VVHIRDSVAASDPRLAGALRGAIRVELDDSRDKIMLKMGKRAFSSARTGTEPIDVYVRLRLTSLRERLGRRVSPLPIPTSS
jgi:hypothetical protein